MAEKPDIPVPDGLQKLMQDFVVTVLRQQPDDILTHACDYFNKLKEARDLAAAAEQNAGGGVKFHGDEHDDEDVMDEEEILLQRRIAEKQKYGRRKSVSAEGYDPDADDDDDNEVKVIHPKSDEQRNRLIAACGKVLLFNRLDQEQFNQVLDAMFEVNVEADHHVIDQGADGDNFYVIKSGIYDVFLKTEVAKGKEE